MGEGSNPAHGAGAPAPGGLDGVSSSSGTNPPGPLTVGAPRLPSVFELHYGGFLMGCFTILLSLLAFAYMASKNRTISGLFDFLKRR